MQMTGKLKYRAGFLDGTPGAVVICRDEYGNDTVVTNRPTLTMAKKHADKLQAEHDRSMRGKEEASALLSGYAGGLL